MEQGLKLLTKLVLEVAPMVANLIQNQSENSLATSNYQLPKILKEFSQFINAPQATKSFSINSETAKVQHQLAVDQRETQLQVFNQERETILKLPEVYKILDNWPLRLYPAQILDSHTHNQRKPLKIFIAPLQFKFDQFNILNNKTSEIELILAEGLRKFLTQHYALQSTIRATEFLAGAWYSKSFHGESSIKALFNVLRTEPILILESEIDGDYLNFRIAYWGIGQENYYSQQITRLPYKAIIQESVKSRALAWKEIRDKLLNLGENLEDIQQIGQDNIYNLEVLEKIEQWEKEGVDISKLSLKYQANHQDLEKLYPTLITCHSLVAAWIADVYYLVNYDVPPLLPELLPSLSEDKLDLQLLQTIVAGYQQAYQGLDKNRRDLIPELTLQLAYSLSHLGDRTWVQAQVDYSINTWLELRQVSIQEFSHPLEAIASVIKIADEPYVQKLQAYFQAISDRQSILAVEKLLNIIAHLKQQPTQAIAHYTHTLTAHFSPIIAISANAEILVSGCADKTINVWNWQTGKQICTLGDKIGEVSSVAVSPDGNFLVVGSYEYPRSYVKIWDLKTGKLIHRLLGHKKPVNVVVISRDGQIFASGSHKIKVWNLHKGDAYGGLCQRISTLWHTSAVHAIAINPNNTVLVSGSADTKIRLWNPQTGDLLNIFHGHEGEVKSLVLSPDGQTLISGSADQTIKIWQLTTGKLLHTLTGHTNEVTSLVLSPDGQTLISGSADQTIRIWRLSTGEVLQTITRHSGTADSVALSSDGNFLISSSADQTIKIRHIEL